MIESDVELALGTAQFGAAYGVAGRGEVVPADEVREILAAARDLGVAVLDTAPAYGPIESLLSELAGKHSFTIVSKIPSLAGLERREASQFVRESIDRSHRRLGARLGTVLFHDADDLMGEVADAVWEAASDEVDRWNVRLGASCYSPFEAIELNDKYPLAAVQLPGNVLDQRLRSQPTMASLNGVEIHLRSVFLQGLLLLPPTVAVERVPAAADALRAWANWCDRNEMKPLTAALCAVKSFPGIRYCIIGVDRLSHLEEIVAAWKTARAMDMSVLSSANVDVIDPRRWRSK